MSGIEYLPPSEPWAGEDLEALIRYLNGQSRISAAYEVAVRYVPAADGSRLTKDALWFELGGRPLGYAARRALSMGVYRELLRPLRRRGVSWNSPTRARIGEAAPVARALWRASRSRSDALDPLVFAIRWAPLDPPAGFAARASAALERWEDARAAYLTAELLFEDGVEVESHPHLYVERAGGGGLDRRFHELFMPGPSHWRPFGVGDVPLFPPTRRHVTPVFLRGDLARSR